MHANPSLSNLRTATAFLMRLLLGLHSALLAELRRDYMMHRGDTYNGDIAVSRARNCFRVDGIKTDDN